jgi:hypothetical protein
MKLCYVVRALHIAVGEKLLQEVIMAKVVGFIPAKVLRERTARKVKPLKVSVGDAFRAAYAKKQSPVPQGKNVAGECAEP